MMSMTVGLVLVGSPTQVSVEPHGTSLPGCWYFLPTDPLQGKQHTFPQQSVCGEKTPSSCRTPFTPGRTSGRMGHGARTEGRGERNGGGSPDPPQLFKHPGPFPLSSGAPRPGSRPSCMPAVNTLHRFPPAHGRNGFCLKTSEPEGHQGWAATAGNGMEYAAGLRGQLWKERERPEASAAPRSPCLVPLCPRGIHGMPQVPSLVTYPFQCLQFLPTPPSHHWSSSPPLPAAASVSSLSIHIRPTFKALMKCIWMAAFLSTLWSQRALSPMRWSFSATWDGCSGEGPTHLPAALEAKMWSPAGAQPEELSLTNLGTALADALSACLINPLWPRQGRHCCLATFY